MLVNAATLVRIHTSTGTTQNQNQSQTQTQTQTITLTPYLPLHVRRYHAWMQDPHIRELTASDPLSLDEEYAMQRSWRTDHDKLTFIVYLAHSHGHENQHQDTQLTEDGMVGDVNLFLSLDDDDDYDDDHDNHSNHDNNHYDNYENGKEKEAKDKVVIGELELMLAEPSARGRGLGRVVLLAFLMYIAKHESEIVAGIIPRESHKSTAGESEKKRDRERKSKIGYFRVRIGKDNIRSLNLFQGLGFTSPTGQPNYFGEIELRRYPVVSPEAGGWEKDVQQLMSMNGLDGWQEQQMIGQLREGDVTST